MRPIIGVSLRENKLVFRLARSSQIAATRRLWKGSNDRSRAAQYRMCLLRQLGLAAAVSCHAADPVLVNVLPFSGKSIQVNPNTIGGSSCNCFSSNSAPFNPTIGSSTYQTIPAVITTGRFIDVNLAKKKLFVATRETGDPQTTISSQPTTNIASVGAQSAPAKFRSNWKYVCQN